MHIKRYLHVYWIYFHSNNNKNSDHTHYEPHNWTIELHYSIVFMNFQCFFVNFDCHICFNRFKHWKIIEFIHLRYIYIDSELFVDYDYIYIIFRGVHHIQQTGEIRITSELSNRNVRLAPAETCCVMELHSFWKPPNGANAVTNGQNHLETNSRINVEDQKLYTINSCCGGRRSVIKKQNE